MNDEAILRGWTKDSMMLNGTLYCEDCSHPIAEHCFPGSEHALLCAVPYCECRGLQSYSLGSQQKGNLLKPQDEPKYHARCGYCEGKWLARSMKEKCAVCVDVPFDQKGAPYFDRINHATFQQCPNCGGSHGKPFCEIDDEGNLYRSAPVASQATVHPPSWLCDKPEEHDIGPALSAKAASQAPPRPKMIGSYNKRGQPIVGLYLKVATESYMDYLEGRVRDLEGK